MSYEKHIWETGEVITAEKLNHLEGGVGSCCPLVITAIPDFENFTFTMDKTFSDVVGAYNDNRDIFIKSEVDDGVKILLPASEIYASDDELSKINFLHTAVVDTSSSKITFRSTYFMINFEDELLDCYVLFYACNLSM